MPRPGVYSSVVKITRCEGRLLKPEDEAMRGRIVRAAFSQRRKTLVNALHSVFGNMMDKKAISQIVTQCGFDERVRGETLGIDDFARIAQALGGIILASIKKES